MRRAAAICNAGVFSWSRTLASSRRSESCTSGPGTRSSLLDTVRASPRRAWTEIDFCGCSMRQNISPFTSTMPRYGSCRASRVPRQHEQRARRFYPAVQNMLLAARALGLGATLTTLYLNFEKEAEAALGLPADWHSYASDPDRLPDGKIWTSSPCGAFRCRLRGSVGSAIPGSWPEQALMGGGCCAGLTTAPREPSISPRHGYGLVVTEICRGTGQPDRRRASELMPGMDLLRLLGALKCRFQPRSRA